MSHFTVAIRLPAATSEDDIERAVEEIIQPYYEQGDDDDDFMEFQDKTDDYMSEWEHDEVEVVDYKGKLYYSFDRELIKALGFEQYKDQEKYDKVIAGLEHLNVSYQKMYESFDDFCEKYHSARTYDIDGEKRYGYYSNPNAKWDWFVIGGRWSEHWPHVNGKDVDYLRIEDISFARDELNSSEVVNKFVEEYTKYYETGEGDGGNPFNGPRHSGLNVGLVFCKDENELTEEDREKARLVKWNRELKPGVARYDVIYPIPDSAEFRRFLRSYFSSLRTFAYLDSDGWVEPGQMGWFGMDGSDIESRKKYADEFLDWIQSGDQRDWIVCVDCHI
jgi:hypothetical protein